MDGNTCLTACATFASSLLMTCTISSGLIRSISAVAGFTFSVANTLKERSTRVSMCLLRSACVIYGGLWHQLLSPHMGIERVLVATIHSLGVFNRLVSFCVRNPARQTATAPTAHFQHLTA